MISCRFRREIVWLAPLAVIGALALIPMRSPPVFPKPPVSRIVTDAAGAAVAMPLPVRIVAGYGASDYLELTHAPEVLARAGGPIGRDRFASGLMNRIYPGLLRDDRLWSRDEETLESLLARDDGDTYFRFDAAALRQVGLAALALSARPRTRDELVVTAARTANTALGQAERGEKFIADYERGFATLERDLRPDSLAEHPRILVTAPSHRNWSFLWVAEKTSFDDEDRRVGVENASKDDANAGRYQDAERVLAMNPDVVVVLGDTPRQFLDDPRWRGLKAVRTRRIYQGLRDLRGSLAPLYGLDYRPLWARWLAELAHPDRLRPELRELLRAHYRESYGYTLSGAEIDDLLRIDENKDAPGYGRFIAAEAGAAP